MAEFTSELIPFSPYVSQIPDSFYTAGMIKQQKYDSGVEKVQGFIDSVAGLEVLKGEHKDYINHRVTDLTTALNRIASSADFGSNNFVNQVGGYASKISSDPIVQNAVGSTLIHKKNLQHIEDERKKGVDTTRNEWDYNKQLSEWLNDGEIRSSFNGRYSNVVDVMGEFYKAFKEAHPNSSVTIDMFTTDENGKVTYKDDAVLQQIKQEGISPKRVSDIANGVFNRADIKNQLRIDGQYSYRGFDQQTLAQSVRNNYQALIDNTNSEVERLRTKMATDKTVDKSTIATQIDELKKSGAKTVDDYKQYASLIATNPEAAKASLYQNNLLSNLMNSFAWSKTEHTIVENPIYKASFDAKKYNLDLAKFEWDKEVDKADLILKQEEIRIRALEASNKKDKATTASGGLPVESFEGNIQEEQGKLGESTFVEAHKGLKQRYSDVAAEGVQEIAMWSKRKAPKTRDAQGRWLWNIGPSGYPDQRSAERAFNEMFNQAQTDYGAGKSTEIVDKMFDKLTPLEKTIKNQENFIKQQDKAFPELKDFAKQVKTSKPELLDYWIANNTEGETAETAKGRLKSRYGNNWKTVLKNKIDIGRTDEFGNSIAGSRGDDANEYERIAKALRNNPKIVPDLQRREEAFRGAQSSFIPQKQGINAAKPEEIRSVNTTYSNILSNLKEGNDSKVINDMLDWTVDDKDGKINSNKYGYYYNRFSGKAYITISRGTETKEVEVPVSVLERNLGATVTDPFWNIHGDDLSISGRTTTDFDGRGLESAYQVKTSPNSPYKVKYHLIPSADGTYAMQLYVVDNQGSLIVDGQPYSPPGVGAYMTEAQIMSARATLSNDAVIQGIINNNSKK